MSTPVDEDEDDRTVLEWLEDEVKPLIDRYEQTRYPVIVAYTEYKVAWVEGSSAEDALKRIREDGDWYERVPQSEPAIDADVSFDHPDLHQWVDTYFGNGVYTEPQGCRWQCPHCPHGGLNPAHVIHVPGCPNRRER